MKPIYPSTRAQDLQEREFYQHYLTNPDFIRQAVCAMDNEILWDIIDAMTDDDIVESLKSTSWPHATMIINAVKAKASADVNEQMTDFIDGYAAQCYDREMEMRAEERRETHSFY